MLFNELSLRADGKHINLDRAIQLSNERIAKGISDEDSVRELLHEGWIVPAHDGGILIAL